MYNTKFDGNDLTIFIDEADQKEMIDRQINPMEVVRVVESFANKIMASKKDEAIQISNQDTGASFALDVKWESETKVSVKVSIINLDNLSIETKPKEKVNLADFPAE